MSASLLPGYVSDELRAACYDLDTALWAAGLSPVTDIGASTHAQAVTVRVQPPRLPGTTPQRQLAQMKRLLRGHRVAVRVEFCPEPYPRLSLHFDTAEAVRRLTTVIAGHLSGLDAVRYRLRLAARSVGVNWYSRIRPHAIWPSELTAGQTFALYSTLFPQPDDTEFEPEDDEAVEEMLEAFTRALAGIGVSLSMWRSACCPHDVEFHGLSEEAASRLADALTRCGRDRRAATPSPEETP
ncbi:hypothetical protein [Streptomyces sp. WM6378]|uniref:hypothetical protein n=1 Tax=Streptomyces sp. WM6378 TaxID=1415557 RepID=UPI00131DF03C|nr:hypothetical protein [Streptomyces sp. WM6378]